MVKSFDSNVSFISKFSMANYASGVFLLLSCDVPRLCYTVQNKYVGNYVKVYDVQEQRENL